jgi:hypothetical protein
MAANQKRRQKQLERKKAKRKQRHKQLIRQKNRGLAEQLSDAAVKAPILDCFLSQDVWDHSFGYVIISRELPHDHVAIADFLVDLQCLGVKNAFATIMTRAAYREKFLRHYEERCDLVETSPATARRLVEDVVEYARRLGLHPHEDYHRAKAIFGDIDPQEADEQFKFGLDGKPYFVAGPHDTPERCYRILSILEHSCGRGGFNFTVPFLEGLPEGLRGGLTLVGPGALVGPGGEELGFDDEYEDDDFDEDEDDDEDDED